MTRTSVPLASEQPTLPVPVAGGFLGLSRGSSYKAAQTGELPTISIGRRKVVPTAALRRMLDLAPEANEPATQGAA